MCFTLLVETEAPIDETLVFYIDKLLGIGKPVPSCADERCVIEWIVENTRITQSIYDGALNAGMTDENLHKVEELYKHTLTEIINQGMSSLGVLEV